MDNYTASSLSPPAINIVCALDGTTFHYQLKQRIRIL